MPRLKEGRSGPSSGGERSSQEELRELNDALHILVDLFPSIRPEVFREMLLVLSSESRAQVVAEHLLRSRDKWVRGRWRVEGPVDTGVVSCSVSEETSDQQEHHKGQARDFGQTYNKTLLVASNGGYRHSFSDGPMFGSLGEPLPPPDKPVELEETFRTASYKTAVQSALRAEFRSLSQSTISAVLAEQNFSYTRSRPVLTDLAAKTWRATISNFVMQVFRFNASQATAKAAATNQDKTATPAGETHFMLQWTPGPKGDLAQRIPSLRRVDDLELMEELRATVLDPIISQRRAREDTISRELAQLVNEHEAELAGALYECKVCFADVTFEQVATCSESGSSLSGDDHYICFQCIQRSSSEALYGQTWIRAIDHERGQLACFVPTDGTCNGHIPQGLAKRAILEGLDGSKVWQQLQARLAAESLRKSGLAVVQCPFCSYSEVDSLYLPFEPIWTLNWLNPLQTIVLLLSALSIFAILAVFYIPTCLLLSPLIRTSLTPAGISARMGSMWKSSKTKVIRCKHLPQRFRCLSPKCRRISCLECHKPWRDPHRCHESAVLSLRTTVEAARTAALKRTCPQCGLSFIKSSGCNRMVCVCGYEMCYICRQGLSASSIPGRVNVQNAEIPNNNNGVHRGEGAQAGYRHFCQHFRPSGGECSECNRCDLYRSENEDEIVRQAGQLAEEEWRAQNGMSSRDIELQLPLAETAAGDDPEVTAIAVSIRHLSKSLWTHLSDFNPQTALDWWVDRVLTFSSARKAGG